MRVVEKGSSPDMDLHGAPMIPSSTMAAVGGEVAIVGREGPSEGGELDRAGSRRLGDDWLREARGDVGERWRGRRGTGCRAAAGNPRCVGPASPVLLSLHPSMEIVCRSQSFSDKYLR